MTRIHPVSAVLAAVAALSATVAAASPVPGASPYSPSGTLEVVVDGRVVPQYLYRGARYVEALKGKDYEIRIHNPYGVRVAVALSVDGLNTIDARHTAASAARKWVLDPHETITISGWQTSMTDARRFFFTSEEASYAARLGQPQNLGLISAVFYRERVAYRAMPLARGRDAEESRHEAGAPAPSAAAAGERADGSLSKSAARPAPDEYAATGIGDRTEHRVSMVHLDLEDVPASSVDIRYEYRRQLVRLGVLPDGRRPVDPLERRNHAQGFEGGFCPDIK